MGCYCDKGYYGPDCSLKRCKYGIDPLYLDDSSTVKYSIYDFAVLTTKQDNALSTGNPIFTDGLSAAGQGYFSIRFYDAFGEDWLTQPIVAGANCATVIAALEAIPNDVIPPGQTWCTRVTEDSVRNSISPLGKTLAGGSGGGISSAEWNLQNDAQHSTGHAQIIKYNAAFWETIAGPTVFPLEYSTASSAGTPGLPSSYDANTLIPVMGYIYRLKFFGNPGALKQPEIEIYLDGLRPSLATTGAATTGQPLQVITKVWTDGQQGESYDYFADHCDNVAVTIGKDTNFNSGVTWLNPVLSTMYTTLKTCLGASDFDSSNNVVTDVYNWDYGSVTFPHLIKLVRTSTSYTDGGYYVALIYYPTANTPINGLGGNVYPTGNTNGNGQFVLLNPFYPPDSLPTDVYEVYTTSGTLALTSNFTEAIFGFGTQDIILTSGGYKNPYTYGTGIQGTAGANEVNFDAEADHTTNGNWVKGKTTTYSGGVSCETDQNLKYRGSLTGDFNYESSYIQYCLNKTDLFILLNTDNFLANPPHINLYTATRMYNKHYDYSVSDVWGGSISTEAAIGTHILSSNLGVNWASAFQGTMVQGQSQFHPRFRVYKFFPSVTSTYNLVAECSNRGICQTDTGICSCFHGYSSDSCSQQNSLAV